LVYFALPYNFGQIMKVEKKVHLSPKSQATPWKIIFMVLENLRQIGKKLFRLPKKILNVSPPF
jgi:hypothetical protein